MWCDLGFCSQTVVVIKLLRTSAFTESACIGTMQHSTARWSAFYATLLYHTTWAFTLHTMLRCVLLGRKQRCNCDGYCTCATAANNFREHIQNLIAELFQDFNQCRDETVNSCLTVMVTAYSSSGPAGTVTDSESVAGEAAGTRTPTLTLCLSQWCQ